MTNLDISRILIVGACARAAAQSAHQAGYQVFAADLFADTDTQLVAICKTLSDYPYDIPLAVEHFQPDAVCITGALENHPSLLEKISQRTLLLTPPISAIAFVRSPRQLSSFLHSHGLDFPEVIESHAPQDGRWLAKPFKSGSGHQIKLVPAGSTCPADCYLQRYIEGCSMSISYLLQPETTTVLGTSELLPPPLYSQMPFQFQGAVTNTLPPQHIIELERLGDLLRKQGILGLVGIDFILTAEDKLVILEVNPRYTATMELYRDRWESPLMAYHIEAFINPNRPTSKDIEYPLAGKRILYARQKITISEKLLNHIQQMATVENVSLSDLPRVGTTIHNEHPILTIHAVGKDTGLLKEKLNNFATRLLDGTKL